MNARWMSVKRLGAGLVLLLASGARVFGADGLANDEVLRRALSDEMARSMKALQIPDAPRPYRIVYTVTDSEQANASASFGARVSASPRRWRTLLVEVRVGDRSFDSGNFAEGPFALADVPMPTPIEDDYLTLRREVWLRTDFAFKRAVEAIGKKRAAEKAQAKGDDEPAFSFDDAKPNGLETHGRGTPAADTTVDVEGLAKIVTSVSGLFRDFPAIATSRVTGEQLIVRQRVLTSDGGWKDERHGLVEIFTSAETQADDGMRLRSWCVFQANSLSKLPPFTAMTASVKKMAAELTAMRRAPVADSGNAVVLFDGRAAGQLVRRLLGDHLSGTPVARTSNDRSSPLTPVNDFASKLGQRVAPPFLDVHDDPKEVIAGIDDTRFGAYEVDDEAIPAERVSLIEKGVLKSLLMSRTPRKELTRSNGHGRGRPVAGAVRGRVGVLVVSAGKAGLSEPALRARAVQEAKAAGKETTVYIVRNIDASVAVGADDDAPTPASGARPGVKALIAFRLHDGKEEPVRGLTFGNLFPRSLKEIVAVGNQPTVYNYLASEGPFSAASAPGTIITPPLVFKNVEVRRSTDKNPRPPRYPHPFFANK